MEPTTQSTQARLAEIEQRMLDALDSVSTLVRASSGVSEGGQPPTHRAMIVQERRRIRALVAVLREELLDLLAEEGLSAADRRAVAAVHVTERIDRIRAECVDLSRIAAHGDGAGGSDERLVATVTRMRELVSVQVKTSQQALATRKVELSTDLHRRHAEIDRLNQEILRRALVVGGEIGRREMLGAVLAAECLERISDQITEIGEQVVFLVAGLFRELADSLPLSPSPSRAVT